MTPVSTAIENGIGRLVGDGMTWRAIVVPVVESMSAATATADDVSELTFAGRTIVPVTAPASAGGLSVATSSTPLVGPPVITGTGSKVWYTVDPSMIEPKIA